MYSLDQQFVDNGLVKLYLEVGNTIKEILKSTKLCQNA